ncbi:MAG TPA: hypothetical protein VMU92_11560 [Acidobacteriaceae bacterium]|nr:hypothetical protein [Acidobacteriaceae bacterium]
MKKAKKSGIRRILTRTVQFLLITIVLVYFADWGLLRLNMMHGHGYSTVTVEIYLATPLKGEKQEYDYMGEYPEHCSRSLFPHGAAPCWWLKKHSTRWE